VTQVALLAHSPRPVFIIVTGYQLSGFATPTGYAEFTLRRFFTHCFSCAILARNFRHSSRPLLQFSFHPGGVFMTVPEELLAILVCPICKTPVRPLADNSGLKCSTCKRIYPVRDDIPVMLPEEATVASE
jgi:uncharacterized protein YbaR (Trm112 family)